MSALYKKLILIILMTSSTICFAEKITINTNEPKTKYLGTKIDMQGKDFIDKIDLNENNYLKIFKPFTDVEIIRNNKKNVNEFSVIVAYNLYTDNRINSPWQFLYIQCPIEESTTLVHSEPIVEKDNGDQTYSVILPTSDVLKKKIISEGSYRFLFKERDKAIPLRNKFNMSGKVHGNHYLEMICLQINSAYLNYQASEIRRSNILKSYGIVEDKSIPQKNQ